MASQRPAQKSSVMNPPLPVRMTPQQMQQLQQQLQQQRTSPSPQPPSPQQLPGYQPAPQRPPTGGGGAAAGGGYYASTSGQYPPRPASAQGTSPNPAAGYRPPNPANTCNTSSAAGQSYNSQMARPAPQQQQQQQQHPGGSGNYGNGPVPLRRQSEMIPSSSSSTASSSTASSSNVPNWGAPMFPPPPPVVPEHRPHSLASLYHRSPSPQPQLPTVVPFAPPPHHAQNICENPDFWELYKATWAIGVHPIHDGIERPAVHSLLPARVYLFNKRCLDIGCGTGKLCRIFRAANARSVVGVDSSAHMITTARSLEAEEEEQQLSRSGGSSKKGVGASLKKLFALGSSNDTDTSDQDKSKMLARRNMEKLRVEDEKRSNVEAVKSLAAATADAEREKQRGQRDGAEGSEVNADGKRFSFSKLFRKEVKQLKPSGEVEYYKVEAEAKRMQREHERRVGRPRSHSDEQGGAYSDGDVDDDSGAAANMALNSLTVSGASGVTLMRPSPVAPPIQFVHSTIEEWESPKEPFDLITCCMTLQFVWDLKAFAHKVSSLMSPNGLLVISVDHPVATASWGQHPIVVKSERNPAEVAYFPLDSYSEEGERTAKYYVEGVRKVHRKVETYINTFLQAGLCLERMLEPRASSEMEARFPELKIWRRKPIFLCLRFRKPKHDDF